MRLFTPTNLRSVIEDDWMYKTQLCAAEQLRITFNTIKQIEYLRRSYVKGKGRMITDHFKRKVNNM